MKIFEIIMTFDIVAKKINELNIIMSKELLVKETWRVILLCSQKYFPFKELGKYNLVKILGIKCKHTTNEQLAITLLGTDKTPIISSKDQISRLMISKANVRDIHVSTHPIHSTASTTLSKMMAGHYGVLMTNGEDMVQEFMGKCNLQKNMPFTLYFTHWDERHTHATISASLCNSICGPNCILAYSHTRWEY